MEQFIQKMTLKDGGIKIRDGRKVEEIIIRKGTPGALLFIPKENRFAISFEEGNGRRFLIFGPSPKRGNQYVLRASEWNSRQGKVTYGSKKYWVAAEDAYATLMVDLKRSRKVNVRSSTARGRKVEP